MNPIDNTSKFNKSTSKRSVSIPRPPANPPPAAPSAPLSLPALEKSENSPQHNSRIRSVSESKLSKKSSNERSLEKGNSKRSVSFSKGNPRRRSSTGKSILKKSQDEAVNVREDVQRRNSKKKHSQSASLESLRRDENGHEEKRGRSIRKGDHALNVDKLEDHALNDDKAPNLIDEDKSIHKHKEIVKSIFSHVNKENNDFMDHIVKVIIHGSDELVTQANIRDPLVRVSVIDVNTGKYALKSQRDRKVTSASESDYLNVILPCLTNTYSFSTNHSNEPKWEEELIFNEDYLYLLQPNIIIGFEILNLVKNKRLLSKYFSYSDFRGSDGWNKIAWGFIKLVGKDGNANTEQKIRLQLYQYPRVFPWTKKNSGNCDLFNAFVSPRVKYPSTIYITISGVPKIESVQVKTRPRLPTEVETGRLTLAQNTWRYKIGHPFEMPNKLRFGIDCGARGAFSCSFSNNGLYLAVACIGVNSYPIKVYDVFTGEIIASLDGHQDLVYQLNWSADDEELISASSDSTVRIWNFNQDGSVFNIGNIFHSSYIYTAVYHPLFGNNKRVIVSGGYNGIMNAWEYNNELKVSPKCISTISGHKQCINSILFDENGIKMYSADSFGYIKIWDSSLDENQIPIFKCINTVDLFYGIPICHISFHSQTRKLLVQTASNTLHILDSRVLKIVTNIDSLPKPLLKKSAMVSLLPPLPNPMHSLFRRSGFSPCGTYILSGSTIYHADSGLKSGVYDVENTVIDVAWHPLDFMCCLVEYGSCRTNIYTYDASAKPLQRPIDPSKSMQKGPNKTSSVEIQKSPLKPSVSESFRKALTELKLGKDLFDVDSMTRFQGAEAKTVII